ncbi:MAG: PilN domain-containing protein [Burkholderiaceae bacterium]|nr:PilN domain-containing protein [Burkholderiaceae bacterium]
MSQQINLFNASLMKKKQPFSASTLLQTLVVALLGVAAVSAYGYYQTAELKKMATAVSAQLKMTEEQAAKMRAIAGAPTKNQELDDALSKLQDDLQKKRVVADILNAGDFGNTRGYSAYLAAFARQIPSGVWLTGLSISGDGKDMSLSGRTLRPELVPEYVSQLKREAIMRGKSFATLKMSQPVLQSTNQETKKETRAERAAYLEFDLFSSDLAEKNHPVKSKDQ